MKTMVIQLKNDAEMQQLSEMLAKMKIRSKVLSDEEIEDIGMGELMLEADRSDKVSRELIMNLLDRK